MVRHLEDLAAFNPCDSNEGRSAASLSEALDASRLNGYRTGTSLTDAIDDFANGARAAGWSVEEAIHVARPAIQRIAPTIQARADATDNVRWSAYFDLYDALIQQVVKTFVTGGMVAKIVCG